MAHRSLLLILLSIAASTAFAEKLQKVAKSNALILKTQSSRKERLLCDGTRTKPTIGVFRSLKRGAYSYTSLKRSAVYTRALSECSKRAKKFECSDRQDNDIDGFVDFPLDDDCTSIFGKSEGSGGVTPTPVPPVGTPIPGSFELLEKPFDGEYATLSFFDHDIPRQFIDTNGTVRIASGETLLSNIDGHQGYDFDLPVGTPVLAAADGVIEFAGIESPFFCPLLNQMTQGLFVRLRHVTDAGTFYSVYVHFDSLSVTSGQHVPTGTVLGLSGNSGCSTAPHLHFDVRKKDISGRDVSVDPFGWSGSDEDPWKLHPEGMESPYLWKAGKAPKVYREFSLAPNPNAGDSAPVAITTIRSMGFNDASSPNNELVKLTLDTRFSEGPSLNLSGFKLVNQKDETFILPAGTIINADSPLTIYSGVGQSTSTTIYLGASQGVLENNGDCLKLLRPSNAQMYYLYWGSGNCSI